MTQTVVALFDDNTASQKAVQELTSRGIARDRVDISQGRLANKDHDHDHKSDEKDGISKFFESLFGNDDENRDRYSNVARTCGSIVTVHATSVEEARQAAEILDEAGAEDIDDLAERCGHGRGTSGMHAGADQTGGTFMKDKNQQTSNRQQGGYQDHTTGKHGANTGGTIPVIKEDVQIGKRQVETGGSVRVRSRIVERPVQENLRRAENTVLRQEIRKRDRTSNVVAIGKSRAWQEALRMAEMVAPTDSTVLITGESGTGKEVIARYVHDLSGRNELPFMSINCGALPESLLESELFGHVKGSFTGAVKDKTGLFAAALGGTFFLDEIGETTAATQVKLLRVLQQREVIPVGGTESIPINARVVAATNRDLEEEIKRGSFRGDLYYRLNVIALHLPPLRHRADDIPLLAEHFLSRVAQQRREEPKVIAEGARDALMAYQWPGNVRELENALERAVILSPGGVIEAASLPARIVERRAEPLVADRTPSTPTLEAIERAYISWVLQNESGNKSRTADVLGIDPSTLYRKLARYGEDAA